MEKATNQKESPNELSEFHAGIKFKYPWRDYQRRVLEQLEDHLSDDHLHIVAPPGSGKTVLGLEVMLRLNRPTLILAPTIAIKNQWITRFCELFLQKNRVPDWISTDIRNPEFLTVTTYQSIHSVWKDKEEAEEIISKLKGIGVGTFVVDEAHHLKNEWWKSLMDLKDSINPVIVGLTATPPYDVSYSEWQRYLELNGPVDAEIFVPELINAGDLCPHQDYVLATIPKLDERNKIEKIRHNIRSVYQHLKHDQTIIEALENSNWWKEPELHYEWIYSNIEFYSATLIYLYGNKKEVPKEHLEIVGNKEYHIPVLNEYWVEIVLENYLFKNRVIFSRYEENQQSVEKQLRKSGALSHSKVSFSDNDEIKKSLSSSISKLEGIKRIADFEYDNLQGDLRQVILCDYIRKEFLVDSDENAIELNKIGVIPVFETLRRQGDKNKKLGVLTGSLVIIPESAKERLIEIAFDYKLNELAFNPLSYDRSYLELNLSEGVKHRLVTIITRLFEEGHVNILIGTKSLLGEGWDAPAINSLILASFVGSFVLSNQMRGRAIRTCKKDPEKTSNIWHLACVDPTVKDGGSDIDLMKRRFRSFVGVSFDGNGKIKNGFDRLEFPEPITNIKDVEKYNENSFNRAANRKGLKAKWISSLKDGTQMVEEIRVPYPDERNYKQDRTLYFRNTIRNFTGALGASVLAYLEFSLNLFARILNKVPNQGVLIWGITIIISLGILFFGTRAINALLLYLKYRDIEKDLDRIGVALVNTMSKTGIIKTNIDDIKVETSKDEFGGIYCHIEGGTAFESSAFINSIQEILSRIDNPRYLIIREGKFKGLYEQIDYHNVPEELGRRKKDAQIFFDQWRKYVGKSQLIYTRNPKGRKLLLKARVNSLSVNLLDERIEHVNIWK
ncbi:DEAD/DEAH box helicase family protein [Mangrovivirga sp. M17]|uniref:DEAD/DEAH box helicase family protein n=1 Tax=Mangrovivirga halotolerans TaxID=2993936 RepID=A0ABT3RN61_9BACT|nr:DEAD/DEAH box helicase family protein [Mangrovivirga halotolerans]MCX2743246.1 DEAD/DEAH box helicase family protein [Mangrovivirga halotolerans]